MSNPRRLILWLVPLMFFALAPLLLTAQDQMSGKQMSVTGCLKQGSDMNGYYIMGQDGKMYELSGKNLGEHLNHTVTVTGTPMKMSHAQEEKKEASEKSEAGSASYTDMKVTQLKMVSESCQ